MILSQSVGHRARLRFLAKDTIVYGLGGALNKAITLLTFPLLARSFSVADFGIIDLLNAWVALIVVLLIFGQDSAVARYFYEHDQEEPRRQVISQSLAIQLVAVAVFLPLSWIMAPSMADWLGLTGQDRTLLIRLMLAQVPFFLFVNFSQGILRLTFQRGKFLFIAFGSTIVTLVGLAVAILLMDLGISGVFAIYLGTRMLFGVVGLWFVRPWIEVPKGEHLRQLLAFAAPFGVICIIASLLPVLERTLVGAQLGGIALGLFAAGAKIATLMSLATYALEIAWIPFSLSLFRQEDAGETFSHVLKIACLLLFASVLVISAVADLLVSTLGSSRYEGAGIVTFALCMALATQSVSTIVGAGIGFSKRSHLALAGYAALLIVAVISIPALSWAYGIAGAAWGSMMAMLSRTLVEGWLAQRAWPMPWSYRGPLLLGAFTLTIGLAHQLSYGAATVGGFALIPLAGAVLLFPLAWLLLLDRSERRLLTEMGANLVKNGSLFPRAR